MVAEDITALVGNEHFRLVVLEEKKPLFLGLVERLMAEGYHVDRHEIPRLKSKGDLWVNADEVDMHLMRVVIQNPSMVVINYEGHEASSYFCGSLMKIAERSGKGISTATLLDSSEQSYTSLQERIRFEQAYNLLVYGPLSNVLNLHGEGTFVMAFNGLKEAIDEYLISPSPEGYSILKESMLQLYEQSRIKQDSALNSLAEIMYTETGKRICAAYYLMFREELPYEKRPLRLAQMVMGDLPTEEVNPPKSSDALSEYLEITFTTFAKNTHPNRFVAVIQSGITFQTYMAVRNNPKNNRCYSISPLTEADNPSSLEGLDCLVISERQPNNIPLLEKIYWALNQCFLPSSPNRIFHIPYV